MDAIEVKPRRDYLLQRPVQRGCAVLGCPCEDVRILSHRRARFHAYLAFSRGETAARTIPSDPSWRLPVGA